VLNLLHLVATLYRVGCSMSLEWPKFSKDLKSYFAYQQLVLGFGCYQSGI
jgi:hypothetical protein